MRSLFERDPRSLDRFVERTKTEAAAEKLDRRDIPKEDGDRDMGVVTG